MNKQGKLIVTDDGYTRVVGGIEWTKRKIYDLFGNYHELRGFTWNVIGGCHHRCVWTMPDGSQAPCYAKTTAEGVAQAAYPNGFEHVYWHPERLEEPGKVTDNSYRIFIDSMSDLMGREVQTWQIRSVLNVCRWFDLHEYQLLTKNAPRLKNFHFPANVWVGVSSAPDFMYGHQLSHKQQVAYMHTALQVLAHIRQSQSVITWMSAEPLSWDISEIVSQYPNALAWLVTGAASNGKTIYQPDRQHVLNLLAMADEFEIPVFFKGNLNLTGIGRWREDFPKESSL